MGNALDVYDEWVEADKQRENSDTFGLGNIAHGLAAELRAAIAEIDRLQLLYIEATNPGIDMEEVKRIRGPKHYVVISEDGWVVEHSLACRLAGTMATCEYHKAIVEVAEDLCAPVMYGRWWIANIDSEGLPGLERADAT